MESRDVIIYSVNRYFKEDVSINIQNGAVGGVHYYEKPVKDRVVELGLITEKEIKRNYIASGLILMLFLIVVAPLMVFFVKIQSSDEYDNNVNVRKSPSE